MFEFCRTLPETYTVRFICAASLSLHSVESFLSSAADWLSESSFAELTASARSFSSASSKSLVISW